jgi:transcriptional regulator with XRE-family HTH domain
MSNSDPTPGIARRVRLERETRRWSLSELAERSGVSKAMISKIERAEASPSAATLGRLAGAFQITLSTLLTRADGRAGRLVRRAQQPCWRDPATRYLRRQIHERPGSPLEVVEISLPKRAKVSFPAGASAFLHQLIWLRRGSLEVREGSELHRLAAGDCLEFGPPADVTFRNPTAVRCEYVVVMVRR